MYYLPPVAFVVPATVGSTVRLPGRRRRTAANYYCRQRVPSSPAGPCKVVNARGTDGEHVTSAAAAVATRPSSTVGRVRAAFVRSRGGYGEWRKTNVKTEK